MPNKKSKAELNPRIAGKRIYGAAGVAGTGAAQGRTSTLAP